MPLFLQIFFWSKEIVDVMMLLAFGMVKTVNFPAITKINGPQYGHLIFNVSLTLSAVVGLKKTRTSKKKNQYGLLARPSICSTQGYRVV